MTRLFEVLGVGLFLTFAACCISSALLQVLAWTRHAREGEHASLKALWKPEGHFDAVGLRQILLARKLLQVGLVAYLSYGLAIVLARSLR